MHDSPHIDPFGDREPPSSLESRVASTLLSSGFVEPRPVQLRRQALRVAAVVLVAAAAFVAGRMRATAVPPDPRPQFLMLLYEDSTYRDDRPVREIVAEYAGWADSLRQVRALVVGEKLGDARAELPSEAGPASGVPTGLFIVRADDLREATSLAATSPHLRYGGRIVIHEIDN